MNRVIFLLGAWLVLLMNLAFPAFATKDVSYTSIIQKQSKKIQELANGVSLLEETVKKLTKDDDALDNSDNIEDSKNLYDTPIVVEESTTTPIDKPIANVQEKDRLAYDLALAALKEGNYDDAEGQFAEFIDRKRPL